MPPPHFCAIVIRLLALHILAIGVSLMKSNDNTTQYIYILFRYQDNYTLEQSVGGMVNIMSSQVKTEGFLMNLFLPLCFRVGIGKKGMFQLKLAKTKYGQHERCTTCLVSFIL